MKICIPKKFYSQLNSTASNKFIQNPTTVLLSDSTVIRIDSSEESELASHMHSKYQLLKSKKLGSKEITPEITHLLEIKQWQYKAVDSIQNKLMSLIKDLESYFQARLRNKSNYFTCKGMSLFTACSQGEKLAATKELYLVLSAALSDCDILYSMANPNYANEDNLKKFVTYYNEMVERLISGINHLESNKALTHHRLGKIFNNTKTVLGISVNASGHLHLNQPT